MARCVVVGTRPWKAAVRAWGVCVRGGCTPLRGKATARVVSRGSGTHSNESKRAARVDFDVHGLSELCVGADGVVLETPYAAAGEGGGRPGGDVDTADAVVATVLRYISGARAQDG